MSDTSIRPTTVDPRRTIEKGRLKTQCGFQTASTSRVGCAAQAVHAVLSSSHNRHPAPPAETACVAAPLTLPECQRPSEKRKSGF
ncbi:hypothetical protein, partial [Neisseria bacilliformis]|uniref:hypothetical protein n=1 Tax=Neisseria bacilliformis TaxID=267212 RepID=UPI003C755E7E